MKTLKPLYFKDTFDFELNELFVRREDGVKILYSTNQTRCLYPDGMEIKSNLYQHAIPSFGDFGIVNEFE